MRKMSDSFPWSSAAARWIKRIGGSSPAQVPAAPASVRLIADAGHPTAEIKIFDATFGSVAEGVGVVRADVPPGLYIVQYKAGRTVRQVDVAVRPRSGEVVVPRPQLPSATSALPTSDTDVGWRLNEHAAELSRTVHRTVAEGGQLFVFARCLAEHTDGMSGSGLFDVSVRTLEAQPVFSLDDTGVSAVDGLARGCTVALSPGTYIVRMNAGPVGILEQSVHVAAGWQTQLLLNSTRFTAEGFVAADPRRAAILMAHQGAGFRPSDETNGWIEAAKVSLAGGTAAAPVEALRRAFSNPSAGTPVPDPTQTLDRDFNNPMLGILGAHLLLLGQPVDVELLRDVVLRLETVVPGHPDVHALKVAASLPVDDEPCAAPPMLRSSWKAILDRTVSHPHLIPAGSYIEQIASRTWGGGIWLVWKAPPAASARAPMRSAGAPVLSASATAESLERLIARLRTLLPRNDPQRYVGYLSQRLGLEGPERRILSYVAGTVSFTQCAEAVVASPLAAGIAQRLYAATYGLFTGRHVPSGQELLVWLEEQRAKNLEIDTLVKALGMPQNRVCRGIDNLASILEGDSVMADPRICFDRILPKDLNKVRPDAPIPGAKTRAAFEWAKLWHVGQTLRIRFLGGTAQQQEIVKKFAPQWTQHANLKFVFSNDLNSEIRISFVASDGAWSYMGTDCKEIPTSHATMNLGWQDEGVVLHEFGHAIGLIHEHQNPIGGIKWNKPAVYADLAGPPNFWDKATTDHNMFGQYDKDQINGTKLDEQSIMLYEIPRSWTLDGFSSKANEVLSEMDKDFAHDPRNYPFKGARQPHVGE
jgi:hypothetical protein